MSTALRLTVAEYDAMVEKGAFDELTQKIELINGEIQAMNPAGPLHDEYIAFMTAWSFKNTDRENISVRVQSGLTLPELNSRPEPDVLWVKAKRYLESHPGGDDVLLAIEVSNSSLAVDRATKSQLYARSNIAEYWIVDVANQLIHVCRDPEAGEYKSVTQFKRGQTVSPLVQPEAVLDLNELFASE